MVSPRRVAIAFGSNLGDRREAILAAADLVGALLSEFLLSSLIETAPVGEGLEHDPLYLNAAGVGTSDVSARDLLRALLAIEQELGRMRPYSGAPRIIDLDLILAGEEQVHESGLTVPHPRFRERRFVLEPLAEIAPTLRDPETGLTVRELLDRLKKTGPGNTPGPDRRPPTD
jgi:2-amino-4-hydroxy-6-hydroxymethyldihydropteridine diphosphokinase